MTIQIASTTEIPTATTVESYQVTRLGQHLQLNMVFTETVAMTDASGSTVYNDLGIPANRQAATGRRWELTLSTANEDHAVRMQTMLGSVMFKAVKAWLQHAGILTYTDADILAGIQALAASRVSIDDFITNAVEQVEIDRRTGTVQPYLSGGTLPQ